MKLVKQKHKLGCVSASIAMISGLSYDKSLKLIHPQRKKGARVFSNFIRLCKVLKKLKFKSKLNFNSDIKKIKYPAIIVLFFSKGRMGHVVVWDPKNKKILDPQLNRPNHLSYYKKHFNIAVEIRSRHNVAL